MRDFIIIVAIGFVLGTALAQENSAQIPLTTGTWVATDALDRTLPGFELTGPPRSDKYVGVFYYLWHGYHSATEIYDISQLLQQNPENPAYGPRHFFHWWGEPEAGYYRSEDPWVIRRNLQMLVNAGVDFIFFDVTNAFTYLDVVKKLCAISLAMRTEGIPTPYLSFLTNTRSADIMNELYDNFYAKNLYPELWFYWQGKPLLMGQFWDTNIKPEVKNFFTFRYSWAWTNTRAVPHHWQWLDSYPQDYGWDKNPRTPEQIPVAVASHPTSNIGASYHDGKQPPLNVYKLTEFTGQGLHFTEQWRRALAVDPQVIMVTQWNEWVAQRFITGPDGNPPFLGNPPVEGTSFFVDVFNQEFNRDIEPMKDGHTDNHYYQLVANIRRFKGVNPPEYAHNPSRIIIDGDFSDWKDVAPIFRDPSGDTMHRHWERYDKKASYIDTTGRNDIVTSRVAYDDANLYFYVETKNNLTPSSQPYWMLLFLDTDCAKSTGWEGYDFAVNLTVYSDSLTSLSTWHTDQWQYLQTIQYRYRDKYLELAIPRAAVPQSHPSLSFYFHWADNIQKLADISEFFLHGDSAPDRRFNYRFCTKPENTLIQGSLVPVPAVRQLRNYPNPFNAATRIQYQVDAPIQVSLRIYDVLGHQVKALLDNQISAPGPIELVWDGTNSAGLKVSTGIYFCQLSGHNFCLQQKILFIQ